MPSSSEKQKRTMAAVAHSPSFAAKAGIPQTVAKEYNHADHLRDMHRQAKSTPAVRTRSRGGSGRAGY